jgi:hypothetical protein
MMHESTNIKFEKVFPLLWRLRIFSSPGAARRHATALSNAEGTFQLHGVLFSEL